MFAFRFHISVCIFTTIKVLKHVCLLFKGIFIVGAKRTPFGTYGGVFKAKSAADLQLVAAQAALKTANVAADKVDSVVIGNVMAVCKFSLKLYYIFKHIIIV